MYVLPWWTVSALTRVLFWCLFDKHQNDPLVSAESVRHSSTYIILYMFSGVNLSSVLYYIRSGLQYNL